MQWVLVPLDDRDVLVAGERVLYRRRRHWATVTPEITQFLAVLFLHGAFMMRSATGMGSVLLGGTILAAAALFPLWREWRDHRLPLLALALILLWAGASGATPEVLGAIVVIVMGIRLCVRVVRWAWFQRTYLTDRRLMEVDGFLGTRINSMPLAKITDVALYRSPVGELLGYGTFRVESAGQDQALGRLDFLVEPERFHDLVIAAPTWR